MDVGPEEAHARAERGNARLAVAAVFFLGERDDTANRRHRAFAVRFPRNVKSGRARAGGSARAPERAWRLDVPRDAPNDVCYPAREARAGRESRRSGMRRLRGRPSWAIRVGALHCSVGCGKKRADARRRVSGRRHARERRFRFEPPERAAHVLGATITRERRVATHSSVPVRARFVSGDAHIPRHV